MTLRSLGVVTLIAFGCVDTALAQRPDAGRPPERTQLEAEMRRVFARSVRQRVGLTDDQMRRLAPITQRHAVERRKLQMEERETRMALQRAIRGTEAVDSAGVDRLLGRLVDVQKRRVQVMESEQRELATIMTPIQRAKFMALQEQVRRELEQRRRPRFNEDGPPPRRRPPPER